MATSKVPFTAARVAAFKAPTDREQAFLWDTVAPGLGLRVKRGGSPVYVYQARIDGRTVRLTIGKPSVWKLLDAREHARTLQKEIDLGRDPRALKTTAKAERAAAAVEAQAQIVTVGEAWSRYTVEGRPKRRAAWKPRYVLDMTAMTAPGGVPKKRGKGLTLPGHLHPLLSWPLASVTEDRLADWFATESKRSTHQATRALMMFRGFLRWASARPEYRDLVNREVGRAPAIIENLPAAERRTDALELAQVSGWWSAVERLPNRTASVYLRALLLTGARREELAALRWDAVDFRWRKMTIADKVGDTRTLPLCPFLASLLAALPRGRDGEGNPSPFVFASSGKAGRLTDPRAAHERALSEAGVGHLTLHGLRRSYALLGEAAGAPAGAIAQAMGHRPSAVHEGYKPRSLDALRPHLERVERFIAESAGVGFAFDKAAQAEPGRPVLVVVGE
jgi:integrase